MKFLTFLLFALLSFTNYSQQSGKVIYKTILLKNGFAPIYEELLIEGDESTYKLIKKVKPDKKVTFNEEKDVATINLQIPDSIHPFIITDFKKRKIISKVFLTDTGIGNYQEYHVVEPFSIKWNLQQDEIKINNFVCKKATTYFRGRNYTAWYTQQIPVTAGPWKFSGLPGLILRIEDNSHEVSFLAEKIIFPFKKKLKINPTIYKDTITITKFAELRKIATKKSTEAFRLRLLTKLPRGATVELTKDGTNDIEKKF